MPELVSVPERYHALDALRALAMLLGIVFHGLLAFVPDVVGWAVVDSSATPVAAALVIVAHSFRLPMFFLIAGFFGRLSLERRGLRVLLETRAHRILVPFVIGWFLLRPLIAFVWILGEKERIGAAELSAAMSRAVGGFVASLTSLDRLFVGTHLWFLYYLALIYGLWLILRAVVRVAGASFLPTLDRVLGRLFRSRLSALVLGVPTTCVLAGMERFGIDTPDDSLIPSGAVLLFYGGLFGLGWCLQRRPATLFELRHRWRGHLLFALILTGPVLWMAFAQGKHFAPWQVFVGRGVYGVMMWAWILGWMGVVLEKLDRPAPPLRYVADASYWLYLAHLPLVVFGQLLFARVDLPWWLEGTLNVCLATFLLLVIYHFFVRSTRIGEVLNGRRYPFRLPLGWGQRL